jgi:hypothetical protein
MWRTELGDNTIIRGFVVDGRQMAELLQPRAPRNPTWLILENTATELQCEVPVPARAMDVVLDWLSSERRVDVPGIPTAHLGIQFCRRDGASEALADVVVALAKEDARGLLRKLKELPSNDAEVADIGEAYALAPPLGREAGVAAVAFLRQAAEVAISGEDAYVLLVVAPAGTATDES